MDHDPPVGRLAENHLLKPDPPSTQTGPAVKVLFIAGWGRSGSTILGSLLGQLDGFLSVGELRFVWDRGLLRNDFCGCSVVFRDCPVWRRALSHLLDRPRGELETIVRLREEFRTHDCVKLVTPSGRRGVRRQVDEYRSHVQRVYRNLHLATGCRVIVDSSKFPSHGHVLSLIPDIDLYILHLVRDPRAVAFSWRKKTRYQPGESGGQRYMHRLSPANSSVHWLVRNALVEVLWGRERKAGRYMRVRYEDFVKEPRATVTAIRDMLGEDSPLDSFRDSHTALLGPTHEVSGNPSRFRKGEVRISQDEEWRTVLPGRDRWLVTMLTWPMLLRYGYATGGR